ncbi:MAG: VWA domain-containing protein [Bacteroidia bacterium]|nr:VWA domain-containing protein [Bacteroidia bacterium]
MRNPINKYLFIAWLTVLIPLGMFAQKTAVKTRPKAKTEAVPDSLVIRKPDTTFGIYNIVSDSQYTYYIDLNINALKDGIPFDSTAIIDSVLYLEVMRGDTDTVKVHDIVPYPFGTVLIMLDISGSMNTSTMVGKKISNYDYAKNIILDLIKKHKLPPYTTYFSVFNEEPTTPAPLNKSQKEDMKLLKPRGYTHLYHSLYKNIEWMEKRPGKKILILLADGEDDPRGTPAPTFTKTDLMGKLKDLNSDFYFYPIGIGQDINATTLKEFSDSTVTHRDTFNYNQAPVGLHDLLETVTRVPWTHTIQFNSKHPPYTANERTIVARVGSHYDSDRYRLGSIFNPWRERTVWQATWLVAIIFVGLIGIFFSFINPWLRQRKFNGKYVMEYWEVKQEGITKYDPLTKYPFQDKDKVVVKCDHMTSIETWNYEARAKGKEKNARSKKKNRCIYYPHECKEGYGPGGIGDFFTQRSEDKKFFWLVAGAIGAFLGWAGFAKIEQAREGKYGEWLREIAGRFDVQSFFNMPHPLKPHIFDVQIALERFIEPLTDHIFLGMLFGAGVSLTLSVAKELSMGRVKLGFKETPILILRLIGYVLMGILIGLVVFGACEMLHLYVIKQYSWIPAILSLILTGGLIGWLLTGQAVRGGVGGMLAGLIAFPFFFIATHYVFTLDAEGWKMLCLIIMGSLMGYVLSAATTRTELAEVECYTRGKRFLKTNITDWLRANGEVTIGRGPSANIRLKGVAIIHEGRRISLTDTYARFILKNENVYIEPIVETEINGMTLIPFNLRKLRDGDEIKFKGKSPATVKFKQIKAGGNLF